VGLGTLRAPCGAVRTAPGNLVTRGLAPVQQIQHASFDPVVRTWHEQVASVFAQPAGARVRRICVVWVSYSLGQLLAIHGAR
jgi:hypothetical protein